MDRAKESTKRSLITEGSGVPVGIAVGPANRNDFKMVEATLPSLASERPTPTPAQPQGMCLDTGDDDDEVREWLAAFGFTVHRRPRGEEAKALKQAAGFKARRGVVERTHRWMNRCGAG